MLVIMLIPRIAVVHGELGVHLKNLPEAERPRIMRFHIKVSILEAITQPFTNVAPDDNFNTIFDVPSLLSHEAISNTFLHDPFPMDSDAQALPDPCLSFNLGLYRFYYTLLQHLPPIQLCLGPQDSRGPL
jgi:hypothetical protein